jgi:hypothetical protein
MSVEFLTGQVKRKKFCRAEFWGLKKKKAKKFSPARESASWRKMIGIRTCPPTSLIKLVGGLP